MYNITSPIDRDTALLVPEVEKQLKSSTKKNSQKFSVNFPNYFLQIETECINIANTFLTE